MWRKERATGADFGRTLAEVFERLGPTYIKLGQILSTRRDLFREGLIVELARLQDQSTTPDFGEVRSVLEKEFGAGFLEGFAEFEANPIASASIASVYKARLRDGRLVAVKVRRPDVARKIAEDLRLLRWMGRYLERLPRLRLIPIQLAMAEFGACLERQLDFRLEAAANRTLRSVLQVEPLIVIPELVEELCGVSTLTMEFIEGFDQRPDPEVDDVRKATSAALRALYYMIFVVGLVHCDLHWGNLHLFDNGRAAMIDFGFMAELPARDRKEFAEFFYAIAMKNGTRCAEITLETALSQPADLDRKQFQSEVVHLVERVSGAEVRNFQVSEFVTQLFDIQRRHKIVGTTAFTMAIVSLLVFEGIAKQSYPELDFQREALPFVFNAVTGASRTTGSGAKVDVRFSAPVAFAEGR